MQPIIGVGEHRNLIRTQMLSPDELHQINLSLDQNGQTMQEPVKLSSHKQLNFIKERVGLRQNERPLALKSQTNSTIQKP